MAEAQPSSGRPSGRRPQHANLGQEFRARRFRNGRLGRRLRSASVSHVHLGGGDNGRRVVANDPTLRTGPTTCHPRWVATALTTAGSASSMPSHNVDGNVQPKVERAIHSSIQRKANGQCTQGEAVQRKLVLCSSRHGKHDALQPVPWAPIKRTRDLFPLAYPAPHCQEGPPNALFFNKVHLGTEHAIGAGPFVRQKGIRHVQGLTLIDCPG